MRSIPAEQRRGIATVMLAGAGGTFSVFTMSLKSGWANGAGCRGSSARPARRSSVGSVRIGARAIAYGLFSPQTQSEALFWSLWLNLGRRDSFARCKLGRRGSNAVALAWLVPDQEDGHNVADGAAAGKGEPGRSEDDRANAYQPEVGK
jgi:hypothetical protein